MAARTKVFSLGVFTSIVIGLSGRVNAQATQPLSEYRPTAYPESYHGAFYPAAELRALPGARAAAVAADAEQRRAQTDLNNAIADIHRTFSRSAEMIAAQIEEHDAWQALQAAEDKALAQIKDDETYKAAVELRDRLGRDIQDQHAKPNSTTERLLAMATVKLSFAASTTAMEAAALSADPQVNVARQRLVDAGKHLAALNQQLDDAVRSSQQVLLARKQLDDARIAALATDAAYIEATRVARAALDFSYHVYDYPYPYAVNTPYYGGGYSYGSTVVEYPVGYPIGWHGR